MTKRKYDYRIEDVKRIKVFKLPYRQVPFMMVEERPNLCYTIESQWGKPDSQPEIYSNSLKFILLLNTEVEEYTVPHEPVQLQIAVHDRKMLLNPYTDGYLLKGGVVYDIYVTMNEKVLLPAPYETNCTDYLKEWRKNNGTGPLNDLMCVERCQLNTFLERGQCIERTISYPHTEHLCPSGTVMVTSEILEMCTKNCEQACSDKSYELKIEPTNNFDGMAFKSSSKFAFFPV